MYLVFWGIDLSAYMYRSDLPFIKFELWVWKVKMESLMYVYYFGSLMVKIGNV